VALIAPRLGVAQDDQIARARLLAGMPGLKPRAKTLVELAENARFYVAARPLTLDAKAALLATPEARRVVAALRHALNDLPAWTVESLEGALRGFAEAQGLKFGQIAQPLRAALTGTTVSPGIFEIMAALGYDETLGRLNDFFAYALD